MALEHLKRKKPQKVQPSPALEPIVQGIEATAKKPKKEPKAKKEKGPAQPSPKFQRIGRLPAGSLKIMTWDGEKWYGVLAVPGINEVFWYEAKAEATCFHGLHRVLERYMHEHPKPVEPTPEPLPVEPVSECE